MQAAGIAQCAVLTALASLFAADAVARPSRAATHTGSVVLRWNAALLQAVRNVRFAPMYTAHALAIVRTCMYDSWAAYDGSAIGTRLGDTLRRPPHERTDSNKEIAVSYAAHRALVDLFPSQVAMFDALMLEFGLNPSERSESLATPEGVGNLACAAVLEFRHDDGANQLGDRSNGPPYSDYTGYVPVNTPEQLVDPSRWQPLPTLSGTPQTFVAPHWRHVTPFALTSPDQFRPRPPAAYPPEAG